MRVSVVIPTHSNYDDCVEAIGSVLKQKYGNMETLVIVDNNEILYKKLTDTFRHVSPNKLKFILTPRPTTLSESRNIGAKEATGDVVVFTDDDIIADEDWIKTIIKTYKKYHAIGVSGEVKPLWKNTAHGNFPEALLWLVGCTYEGFCPKDDRDICKVRNGIGPNFSFRKEVFKEVGYFNENLGFANKAKKLLQGEEAEFSLRVISRFGNKIVHNRNAVVYHKVPQRKIRLWYMLKRAFWQGYSKAIIEKKVLSTRKSSESSGYILNIERKYLKRIIDSISNQSLRFKIISLAVILCVGSGYLVGKITVNERPKLQVKR